MADHLLILLVLSGRISKSATVGARGGHETSLPRRGRTGRDVALPQLGVDSGKALDI